MSLVLWFSHHCVKLKIYQLCVYVWLFEASRSVKSPFNVYSIFFTVEQIYHTFTDITKQAFSINYQFVWLWFPIFFSLSEKKKVKNVCWLLMCCYKSNGGNPNWVPSKVNRAVKLNLAQALIGLFLETI